MTYSFSYFFIITYLDLSLVGCATKIGNRAPKSCGKQKKESNEVIMKMYFLEEKLAALQEICRCHRNKWC